MKESRNIQQTSTYVISLVVYFKDTDNTDEAQDEENRFFLLVSKRIERREKKKKVISHLFIKHYIIQIFVRGSAGRKVNLTEFFPVNLLSSWDEEFEIIQRSFYFHIVYIPRGFSLGNKFEWIHYLGIPGHTWASVTALLAPKRFFYYF